MRLLPFLVVLLLPALAWAQETAPKLPGKAEAPPPNMAVDLVAVEADGKDPADAKAQAVKKGADDAFRQLARKLYAANAELLIGKMRPGQAEGLVESRQVENEKVSGNHYQGVIDYRFDAKKVQALVKDALPPSPVQEIVESATNTRSVLLLPVLEFNDTDQLWEDENSWRKSWNHIALQIGRGQLIVPYGDRRDREDIGTDEALHSDFKEYKSIADRYGVKEVYVAVAQYASTDLSLGVTVLLRKLTSSGVTTETIKFESRERETREQQLERVALDLARRLTKIKGVANESYQTTRDNEITIEIAHEGMKEFRQIIDRLQMIPNVKRVRATMVSYNAGTVVLLYRTSPELLGKSFAAQGFRIYKAGDSLILTLPK